MSDIPQRDPADEELWDFAKTCARTSLSGATIYRMLEDGSFPQPRRIGKRNLAWLRSEIVAWMVSRPVASASDVRKPPAAGRGKRAA